MVVKEADEETAMLVEIRKCDQENEGNGIHLLPSSDKVDAPLGLNHLSLPLSKTLSMDRRMGADAILKLGNDKNDLVWLLSPPGTPLLTSLKKEAQVQNLQLEPATMKPTESKHSNLPSKLKSSTNSTKRSPSSANRRSATPTGKPKVSSTSKPLRSSTPSGAAARTSPTATTPRSSLPALKSTPKQSVPTIRSSTRSNTRLGGTPKGQAQSSLATKSPVTVPRTAMPPNGTPPTSDLKSPRKSLPRRPVSASRVRPSASSSGKSFPPIKSRRSADENDEVNPVMMGTKMVERIVNMRKLAPPKQDSQLGHQENLPGKYSSSMEKSGFGRSLSSKSLDMAIRHMDIRGTISGKQKKARSIGPTKSKNPGVSESPLTMSSSNTSSEAVSTNSNSTSLDGSETEDNDLEIVKVSPVIMQGR